MSALRVSIITLFPDAVLAFARAGLLGRGIERGVVEVDCFDPREFTEDRHRTVDDRPFGGGPGMVLLAEPLLRAMSAAERRHGRGHRVLTSPAAPRFDQRAAERLSQLPHLLIVCGRYEGIDERVRESHCDEAFSLGDFVLNGGEVAALAMLEAIARLRPHALGNERSVGSDSFALDAAGPRLEHPQYTRPARLDGHAVPSILRSGDARRIAAQQLAWSLERTWKIRPELRAAPSLPDAIYVLASPPHPQAVAQADLATPDRAHPAVPLRVEWIDPEQPVPARAPKSPSDRLGDPSVGDPLSHDAPVDRTTASTRADSRVAADDRGLLALLNRRCPRVGAAPRAFVRCVGSAAGPEPAPALADDEVELGSSLALLDWLACVGRQEVAAGAPVPASGATVGAGEGGRAITSDAAPTSDPALPSAAPHSGGPPADPSAIRTLVLAPAHAPRPTGSPAWRLVRLRVPQIAHPPPLAKGGGVIESSRPSDPSLAEVTRWIDEVAARLARPPGDGPLVAPPEQGDPS